MPQSSHRIRSLLGGDADGWTVFYRARRMKEAGVPVLELTIGEHDIGTDAAILDEMHRAAQAGHTGYAAVPGIPRPARQDRRTAGGGHGPAHDARQRAGDAGRSGRPFSQPITRPSTRVRPDC